MSDIQVRRATVDDAGTLTRLRAAFVSELSAIDDELRFQDLAESYFRRALASESFIAWLADAGDETVAVVGVVVYDHPPMGNLVTRQGYVLNVYTAPEWRGRGLATKLTDELMTYAAQSGLRLWLIATDQGRPLYESVGFRPDARFMRWR